ncbi:MAG: YkvA family protein [Pseudomonadales bacterium]
MSKTKDKIQKHAKRVTQADLDALAQRSDELKEELQDKNWLGRLIDDAGLMLSLIKDYWRGDYRDISWLSITAIVIGLAYIFNPFDLVPDFIPLIGQLDDILVLTVCLKLVEKDLTRYQAWKETRA